MRAVPGSRRRTREQQDRFAMQSHQKAFRATRMGRFRDEIVPLRVSKKVAGQEVAYRVVGYEESGKFLQSLDKAIP